MAHRDVEMSAQKLVQGDPLALDANSLGPGADDLELTLQLSHLLVGLAYFLQRPGQFLARFDLLPQTLPQTAQNQPNGREGKKAGEAVPVANDLAGIKVPGEIIHSEPNDAAEQRHSQNRDPPEIPRTDANRYEVENEEEKLIAGDPIDVAYRSQRSQADEGDPDPEIQAGMIHSFKLRKPGQRYEPFAIRDSSIMSCDT